MTLVCAWCDTCLGEKAPLSNPGITHGMCGGCLSDRLGAREETFGVPAGFPSMAPSTHSYRFAEIAAPAH